MTISRFAQYTLVGALLATATAQAPPEPPQPLKLGTWNLEFLGAEGDFRNKLPLRDELDYELIGRKVRELGVAVLAVQEICGEPALQKVATAAGASWRVLLGTTGGWDDGKNSQQIGFLYDSTIVELLQAEELLELPRKVAEVPIFHRVPVSVCFRARATGFDFRAVTVHLKAGQKADDEQKRRLESTLLHEWIVRLQRDAREDQDIVVLGDFNSTYGSDPQRAFEQGGSLQYVVPATAMPTIMHFPEPIDQVAVARAFDELQTASFTVHSDLGGLDKDRWRKTYSDHFPVSVQILAANDTDAEATFRPVPRGQVLPASQRPALPAGQTAAAPAAGGNPLAGGNWPPKVGDNVRVVADNLGSPLDGKLAAALPQGLGGWVAVQTAEGIIAVPQARVIKITLR